MEKGDDEMVVKGASVVDRAKDEVVAITDTLHGALHSVKKETEEKAERLKGGLKHLLHKGPAHFYDKAKQDIKDHLFSNNLGKGGGGGIVAESEINGNKEGETNYSSPAETETSISIPVQQVIELDAHNNNNKEEGDHNNSAAYFAQFFEKCCQPFNNKKDY